MGLTVFMKGVSVTFDGATINRVLGLLNTESDEFKQLFRNPGYNDILKNVVGPNAKWSIKNDGGFMRFQGEASLSMPKLSFTL